MRMGVKVEKIILKTEHIQKYYGNKGIVTKAIDDISFEIKEGEFVGIMGASGSGKTTLLNCISTIDTVTAGNIIIDGDNITKIRGSKLSDFRREKLGFIFQQFNLLDTLTAYENIALALSILKVPVHEIEMQIAKTAKLLNIEEVLHKYPYEMSGGQQQRVAAARAIITKPALILADEPTGALDSRSARMLLSQLTELNEKEHATILMVTHDSVSASYCKHILFIKDGKIFHELMKGNETRKEFYEKILEVVSLLGGEQDDDQ
jgi:putative ABC transport system ATP-binding protein